MKEKGGWKTDQDHSNIHDKFPVSKLLMFPRLGASIEQKLFLPFHCYIPSSQFSVKLYFLVFREGGLWFCSHLPLPPKHISKCHPYVQSVILLLKMGLLCATVPALAQICLCWRREPQYLHGIIIGCSSSSLLGELLLGNLYKARVVQ